MEIVKVYKTDVDDSSKAMMILKEIRRCLPGSDPSFDLEDCDKVLRVENPAAEIDEPKIRTILKKYGYEMEILP